MKYSAADLAVMARMVEHAKYADPNRYYALINAIYRRSGLRREEVMKRITQLARP